MSEAFTSIVKSLEQAALETAQRKKCLSEALDRLPVGYEIKGRRAKWRHILVAGDSFWTDGKKYLASWSLLEHLGTLLEDHIPYYDWRQGCQ